MSDRAWYRFFFLSSRHSTHKKTQRVTAYSSSSVSSVPCLRTSCAQPFGIVKLAKLPPSMASFSVVKIFFLVFSSWWNSSLSLYFSLSLRRLSSQQIWIPKAAAMLTASKLWCSRPTTQSQHPPTTKKTPQNYYKNSQKTLDANSADSPKSSISTPFLFLRFIRR